MLMSSDNQRSSNREPFHLIVSAIGGGGGDGMMGSGGLATVGQPWGLLNLLE